MPRWNDVIQLCDSVHSVNSKRDNIITYVPKEYVYANRKSVRQSEFYQADARGLRPEMMFEIRTFEYQEENFLLYNDKFYEIIRSFEKGEFIEVICKGVVNNANA